MSSLWSPAGEADLVAMAGSGRLEEGIWLELKRELASGDSANPELAKDLAAMANESALRDSEGGLLVIGVVDPAQRTPGDPRSALHRVPLDGLPERVEQIARSSIDPPLEVTPQPIVSQADPARGYLAVWVPASPQAPHMVNYRYPGRGSTTTRWLSEGEIAFLYHRRRTRSDRTGEALDDYIALDPVQEAGHQPALGHLYVVAVPLSGADAMVLDAVRTRAGSGWMQTLVAGTPLESHASTYSPRPGGWALTGGFEDGRQLAPDFVEKRLFEVEVTEDGTIRLLFGRATDVPPSGEGTVVLVSTLAELTFGTVCAAARVAEFVGYPGSWGFGVAVTHLKGARPWTGTSGLFEPAPYPNAQYRKVIETTSDQVTTSPQAVVALLLLQLFRGGGLGPQPSWDPYIELGEPGP